jgi:carnitine monooxygenase subunit
MSREQLIRIAKRNLAHSREGTLDLADSVHRVPASHYVDPERFSREVDAIFKRVPLSVAFTAEVSQPGDYKAMEVAGVPVLIVRGADLAVRAFVNMCSHRGAIVVPEGTGNGRRFSCPYHAWTYDQHGDLVGILDRELFGDVDTSCLGLTPLPVAERSGIIFVVLTPGAAMDIDGFLSGYGEMLAHLGLDQCRVVGTQTVAGPNWKLAYDGYLDLYHLPILHRDTFGTAISNKALYDAWGPHQRVTSPGRSTSELEGLPEDQWPITSMTLGVWTIFPHISIAAFDAGGRVYMISQLFPGEDVGSSITIQNFLHTQPDAPGQAEEIERTMKFLRHVVENEDYFTGLRIQRALKTGTKTDVLFGRNEAGGQRFHAWVEALLGVTSDAARAELFANGIEAVRA